MKKIDYVLNMNKEQLRNYIIKLCPHTFDLVDDFHEIDCKGDCNLYDDKCLCYYEDDGNKGCIQCWNKKIEEDHIKSTQAAEELKLGDMNIEFGKKEED